MHHSQAIRLERHERIAKMLQRDAEALIERWSDRAAAEQPDARRAHRDVLRDGLAAFLTALGRSLGESSEDKVHEHRAPAYEHGEHRWESGWSLTEVIRDYQLLRTVLIEYFDETLDRPLKLREILALNQGFDEAIAASVGSYVASREEAVVKAERAQVERAKHEDEERLRQQAKAHNEIDRRKDEFLAILGHELRNPLAPIRNVLQVLRLKPPDAKTLNWSREVVERQVRHMTRLVDDLLDVTRIGQGKIELRPQRLDLGELVRVTAEDHRAALEASGLECRLEVPERAVWVRGDSVRLAQVVGNLLHNATKFTSAGGRVEVQLRCDDAAGRAVVGVRDTGAGIERDDLPFVFDTFRQADRSRHQSRGGLGLGLALVKGLIEIHGGAIEAASAGAGQGAEFTLWLPLADE
jgi:signal transduction histidine kinase